MKPNEIAILITGAVGTPVGFLINPQLGLGVLLATAGGFAAAKYLAQPKVKKTLTDTTGSTGFGEVAASGPYMEWIPFGKTITVHGHAIKGGFFFGSGVLDQCKKGIEPGLVDPTLPVSPIPAKGEVTEFWARYSTSSATARATYLEWAAAGRKDPDVDIGIVFMHFYGMERRLANLRVNGGPHQQALSRKEALSIKTETERLLSIYGGHKSFREYATTFVGVSDVLASILGSYPGENPKLSIGRLILEKKPIPHEVARLWAMKEQTIPKKDAVINEPDLFAASFKHHYAKRFGEGLVLSLPESSPRISATHTFASAGFEGLPPFTLKTKFYDVTGNPELVFPLSELFDISERSLSTYLKMVKDKNPNAYIYMPSYAADEKGIKRIATLRNSIRSADRELSFPRISAELFGKTVNDIPLFSEIAERLEEIGIGCLPDPRRTEIKSPDELIMFFMDDGIPSSIDEMLCSILFYVCNETTDAPTQKAIRDELSPQGVRDNKILEKIFREGVDHNELSKILKNIPGMAKETIADACGNVLKSINECSFENAYRVFSRMGMSPSDLEERLTDGKKSEQHDRLMETKDIAIANNVFMSAMYDSDPIRDIAETPIHGLHPAVHAFAISMYGVDFIPDSDFNKRAVELGIKSERCVSELNETAENVCGKAVFTKKDGGYSVAQDALTQVLAEG